MKRRFFVTNLSRLSVAITIAPWRVLANSPSVNGSNSNSASLQVRAMFAELAYLLLPLQPADSEIYQIVAEHLMRQMVARPATHKLLSNGLDQLNQSAERGWLSVSRAERKVVMVRFIELPYIAIVRWVTHEQVLRNRHVWAQVGYQGSAIEKGGYLKRGFNDIDWLPVR